MSPQRARTPLLLLALLAASCGAEKGDDFVVRGVGVRVRTDAPFARQPDLPARLEALIDASVAYFGGSWEELQGKRITLSSGPYVPCDGASGVLGCYDGEIRVATWDPGVGTVACAEQTVLVHEIGHALLGDRLHHDPRWMDFAAVSEELAGRKGYLASGETDCAIAVSVWRHPLDSP
jgi:hypothetical protein